MEVRGRQDEKANGRWVGIEYLHVIDGDDNLGRI